MLVIGCWLLAMCISAVAQRVMISGHVADERTGAPIAQASVTAEGTGVAVVTNDDGFFSLKADTVVGSLRVSHLGYQSRRVRLKEPSGRLSIRLSPTAIQLKEVVVWTGNPRELMNIAISKIPENYSRQPELYNCFYRETAMKRQHFIYVAEGVVDMFKTPYSRGSIARDRVAIRKGRRLLSPKRSDTLGIKVLGGPVQPIQLDLVKNTDFLLNREELEHYKFTMEEPKTINDRPQYVVSIAPYDVLEYALFHGKFYIDRETLAFTRAELSLDMDNREKATAFMLVRKPFGVRFKPKELSCLVDYRYEDGVTRISYIRNTFRFNCDWKRRLLSTSFTAFCEMVVTDKGLQETRPIAGRNSFDSRDAFYDKVDYFLDPNFWEDYNIIEPTVTLDRAIGKILKKWER